MLQQPARMQTQQENKKTKEAALEEAKEQAKIAKKQAQADKAYEAEQKRLAKEALESKNPHEPGTMQYNVWNNEYNAYQDNKKQLYGADPKQEIKYTDSKGTRDRAPLGNLHPDEQRHLIGDRQKMLMYALENQLFTPEDFNSHEFKDDTARWLWNDKPDIQDFKGSIFDHLNRIKEFGFKDPDLLKKTRKKLNVNEKGLTPNGVLQAPMTNEKRQQNQQEFNQFIQEAEQPGAEAGNQGTSSLPLGKPQMNANVPGLPLPDPFAMDQAVANSTNVAQNYVDPTLPIARNIDADNQRVSQEFGNVINNGMEAVYDPAQNIINFKKKRALPLNPYRRT